jgi:disulfide bond formation protein DsbB
MNEISKLAARFRPPEAVAGALTRLAPWSRLAWRYWPAAAAATAAALLAIAHAFEAAGYEPCALCLRQRELHWAALAVAAGSAVMWARRPEARATRAVDAVLGAIFLSGAVLAFYHAGVEWKLWPGPATCVAGAGGLTGADIAAALGRGGPVALCDEAAWRDPVLRLSMAGWNGLLSLALGVASFFAAVRGEADIAEPVDG